MTVNDTNAYGVPGEVDDADETSQLGLIEKEE